MTTPDSPITTSALPESPTDVDGCSNLLAEELPPYRLNQLPLPPTAIVMSIGSYLIGDTDDTLLSGHPDIRY